MYYIHITQMTQYLPSVIQTLTHTCLHRSIDTDRHTHGIFRSPARLRLSETCWERAWHHTRDSRTYVHVYSIFVRMVLGWIKTQRVVDYESIKWEFKIRCIYECRCDARLQVKTKEFTRLTYTGLVVELEHLKIETRLINEKFVNTMGEYVT
jgi:hypothetical protein